MKKIKANTQQPMKEIKVMNHWKKHLNVFIEMQLFQKE